MSPLFKPLTELKYCFKNKDNNVKITNEKITYNSVDEPIERSYYFSSKIGHVSTKDRVFKWSKHQLHIYSIIDHSYIERMDEIDYFEVNINSLDTVRNNVSMYFEITSERIIKLEISDNIKLLSEINTENVPIELFDLHISKHVKEYISRENEILFIDEKNHRYRWKNIPIGKI
jgi:hypothetical protein